MKAKSYKLKYTPTEEQLIAAGAKRGGIWINEESVFYITKCFELPKYDFEFSISIYFKDDISDWNDFDNVLVLDEDFLQPYTPFYGNNYKKEISNHPCLEYCIKKYNEFMDGFDFFMCGEQLNDYKELIELLAHPTDGRDSADIMIAAADAIEQLVAEYNELDNAHGELFIEYHKVKKQRDAAIAWLPRVCGYCKHYNGLTCNNKDCKNISGVNTGWKWRGEQE